MATSHAQCTHDQVPSARAACRLARRLLSTAERYGLVITDVSEDKRVAQYRIEDGTDLVTHTVLLLTVGWRTPRISRRTPTGEWKPCAYRSAYIWLQMMKEGM